MIDPVREFVGTVIILIITFCVIYNYRKGRLSVIQSIIIGVATETFAIWSIGPTITTRFFIVYYFFLSEFFFLLRNYKQIRLKFIFLIPLISGLIVILFNSSGLELYESDTSGFLLSPVYYYIKHFFPFVFVANKIRRESTYEDIDKTFAFILKVATYSCYLALFQLAFHIVFHSEFVEETFLGVRSYNTYKYQIGNLNFLRMNALFYEPKGFSAILAIAIPICIFKYRKYQQAIFYFIVAVLTVSQTFFAILFCLIFSFILFKEIKTVLGKFVFSLLGLVGIFLCISAFKSYLFASYVEGGDDVMTKMVMERAAQRFDLGSVNSDNELLGIPLQPAMELPVVKFMKDHPGYILTGHGPSNNMYIPVDYYAETEDYDARLRREIRGGIDMGWFNLTFEFGIMGCLIFMLFLTNIRAANKFKSSFYTFLLLAFFFQAYSIEWLIIVFYVLIYYHDRQDSKVNLGFT